jgi:P27 family predicted phage terminase small subunit
MAKRKLPTKILEANGAFKKNPDRRNTQEPNVVEGLPEIPVEVAANPIAEQKWYQVCDTLSQMQLLATCDFELISLLAVSYGEYRKALDHVNKHGQAQTVVDEAGNHAFKANPCCAEMHKHMDRIKRCCIELGLTPAARSKVKALKKDEGSAFDEWLKTG